MTFSRIFKELNRAEIDKVISNLYGSATQITECNLLEGGLFNTTYLLKTDTDRTGIVLRVAPVNQHLLFDFEKSMMAAEPLFFKMLESKNIPTSQVIYYDNSFNIIEREYIVFQIYSQCSDERHVCAERCKIIAQSTNRQNCFIDTRHKK